MIKNNNHYGSVAFGVGALFFILISQAMAETTEATAQAGSAAKTFFTQFVIAGGPIVWLILLPMSIATVCLAIESSPGEDKPVGIIPKKYNAKHACCGFQACAHETRARPKPFL